MSIEYSARKLSQNGAVVSVRNVRIATDEANPTFDLTELPDHYVLKDVTAGTRAFRLEIVIVAGDPVIQITEVTVT